jgi:hypothetical protein
MALMMEIWDDEDWDDGDRPQLRHSRHHNGSPFQLKSLLAEFNIKSYPMIHF